MAFLGVFAFTSLVMETYLLLGPDLREADDPLGRLWAWYAARDPVFFDPPLFLRWMCGLDALVFGPFHVAAVFAFARRRAWIRLPGLAYAGTILYSNVIYFGVELLDPVPGTDLSVVALVNLPYVMVPVWLAWRLRAEPVFGSAH
jgi:hypothetical protein